MLIFRFIAILALVAAGSGNPTYKGPIQFGTFGVIRPLPVKALLRQLGKPASGKSPFCYRYGESAYLRINRIEEQPESAGELLVSSIPICPIDAVAETGTDFRSWKTGEGIALGATKEDLLREYGRPTSVEKPDHVTDRRFFSDYAPRMHPTIPIAREVLLYNGVLKGLPESWRSARFGIWNDKVTWIMLTIDD